MKNIFSVLVISNFVGVSLQCCAPMLWSGEVVTFGGLTVNDGKEVEGSTKMYYDFNNSRLATNSSMRYHGAENQSVNVFVLRDYKTGFIYTVANKTCIVQKTEAKMTELCIADGAKFLHESYLGNGDEHLNTATWGWSDNGTNIYFTITLPGCIPVSIATYATKNAAPFVETRTFFGINDIIWDPNVFDVPAACNNASVSHGIKLEEPFLHLGDRYF